MVGGIAASVMAAIIVAMTAWLYRNRHWLRVLLPAVLTHRGADVRISIASILRLHCEGRYVLFRTPLRPEAFAPPGGVVKYYPEASAALDSLEFRPQAIEGGRSGRGKRDLRGYVTISKLAQFLRWYRKAAGRESHTDALRRELREEFEEVGAAALASYALSLDLRHVRTIVEGPSRVGTSPHLQVRIIEVYGPSEVSETGISRLCGELRAATAGGSDILFVSDEEIACGRSNQCVISHHASYLLGSRRLRPDLPPL